MSKDVITSSEIGAAIRVRRKELGFSQEQLAEKVGVSYQQIQRYENGHSMLNVENIQRIAKALHLPVTVFFTATLPQTVSELSVPYSSSDEKSLLRHFRELVTSSDRQLVIGVARRIAKR